SPGRSRFRTTRSSRVARQKRSLGGCRRPARVPPGRRRTARRITARSSGAVRVPGSGTARAPGPVAASVTTTRGSARSKVTPMPSAAEVPILEVEGLGVVLGRRTILASIDLTVRAGAIVGVVGASGAGKSCLFRAIAGDLDVARGAIRLAGKDVTRTPLW